MAGRPAIAVHANLMGETAEAIDTLARNLGEGVRKVIVDYAASKGVTARVDTGDIEAKLAAEAEAVAKGHSKLYGATHRHRLERERLPLPEAGYTNPEARPCRAFLTNTT